LFRRRNQFNPTLLEEQKNGDLMWTGADAAIKHLAFITAD
jgi:hypothetical protein